MKMAAVAAILAMGGVAGCGDDAASRVAPGSRVIVVAENGKYQWTDPIGDGGHGYVGHGVTGLVVEDGGDGGDGRTITVRFEDSPPWTGKILRKRVRPVR